MYNVGMEIDGLVLLGKDSSEVEASGFDVDTLSPDDDLAEMTEVHTEDGSAYGQTWGSTTALLGIAKSLSRNSRRALGSQVHAPKGSASGPEIGPKNSYSDPLWRNLKGRERVSGRALSLSFAD